MGYPYLKKTSTILPGCAILILLLSMNLQAQSSFCGSGNSISGTSGSVSYSIGQSFILNCTGLNGHSNGGIQQPFSVYTLGIDNQPASSVSISVYPNPAGEYFKITTDGTTKEPMQYALSGVNGQPLQTSILKDVATISLIDYPSGTYILDLFQDEKLVKTFRIIKN